MAESPYSGEGPAANGNGSTAEIGGYQILNPIAQGSDDSDYDYPTDPEAVVLIQQAVTASTGNEERLELVPSKAAAIFSPASLEKMSLEAGGMSLGSLGTVPDQLLGEGEGGGSLSSSEGDSSDPDASVAGPSLIRQVHSKPGTGARAGMEGGVPDGGDDKLFLTGNLSNPFHGVQTDPAQDDNEFADEGIYQGLVMTDTQKKNLGILPESLYMTTNLLQKSDLIESLCLSLPVVAVEVPEVPLPPNTPSIFKTNTVVCDGGRGGVFGSIPRGPPPRPPRKEKADIVLEPIPSRSAPSSSSVRDVNPRYRDLILRPPPLPPMEKGANRAERKAHAVVENLLKSEAAYLTSLNIAIKVYRTPLLEMTERPTPVLTVEEVETIFGPICSILEFQEIFYCAITTRTLDWTPIQKIGDVLSSLSTKEVIQNYSTYVNNFTVAMATLEKAINKKPKFVQFLKEKYAHSRTSLSLQGLLLKPIQRFPQYIMFLQDLIKYTISNHPDRVTLQMALAKYEGIANFLNESKRQQEQKAVVQNLTHKVSHLPFKLTDGKRWLHRQDIVTRIMVSSGEVVEKERCLLLFNNMVLCASMKRRKKKGLGKSRVEDLESSTGSRDFQSISNYFYTCKWFCPLEELEISQPDYLHDIWDRNILGDPDPEYVELKRRYKELEEDNDKISRISRIAATLQEDYTGLTTSEMSKHLRVLQRKIAELKAELKIRQQGRLDVSLPSRDNDKRVHHTYVFKSEQIKLEWINNLRYSKRKLNHPVKNSWVIAEDVSQGDIFEVSYKLPLFVENYTLNMINNELLSVQCATRVGQTYAWLASGDSRSAQVSIVECVTPTPLILECFKVNSKCIIDILYVPPSSFCVGSNHTPTTPTVRRGFRSSRMMLELTQLAPYLPTVWMGSQCGKVIIYNADSAGDESKQCLATVKLSDTVTSLQYYKDQVFISLANGSVAIFKRNMSGFDLTSYRTVSVSPSQAAIRCSCIVGNKLWLGVGGSCFFFNMQTYKVEGSVEMASTEGVAVSRMVCQGEGVWVCYKGSSSLELFHTISKSSLQNIDIRSTLGSIIKRHKLESRLAQPTNVHVTAIMSSSGYLWIGTSVGAVMVYHIPHLESVPIVSGKPYLAMDAHVGSVRVLLTMETMGTFEGSRLSKFLADEHYRSMQSEVLAEEEEEGEEEEKEEMGEGQGESHDPDNSFSDLDTMKRRSMSDPTLSSTLKASNRGGVALQDVPAVMQSNETTPAPEERYEMDLERSTTPLLPDPSTLALEESVILSENPLPKEDLMSPEVTERDLKLDSETEDTFVKEDLSESLKTDKKHNLRDLQLIPPTMDESLRDSGDYTIPHGDFLPPPRPHSSGVLYGNEEEEDPYSVPRELDAVQFQLQAPGGGGGGGDSNTMESPYSVPRELDAVAAGGGDAGKGKGEEDGYDFPAELLNKKSSSSTDSKVLPYEDPATLAKDPSSPLSQMFSTGLLRNSLRIPGRPTNGGKGGTIFVLTGGRGLINLRPGKKAQTFNKVHEESEGCMIAYEIEL